MRVPLVDSDGDGLDDQWERNWFGSLARNGDGDFDEDGQSDREEFTASTNPTSAASVFKVTDVSLTSAGVVTLRWNSVPGRRYRVQSKGTISPGPWIDAPNATVMATITNSVWSNGGQPPPQRFYKVVVE